MDSLLTICIPTYNGVDFLKKNLDCLIKNREGNNYRICISDNCSNDGTYEYMKNITEAYNFIDYYRNDTNYGFEYNYRRVLKLSKTKYSWLLGTDDLIDIKKINNIIHILKDYEPKICAVNSFGMAGTLKKTKSGFIESKEKVMSKFCLHISWMSTLIVSDDFINSISVEDTYNNAFPHLIDIFKYLDEKCSFYFINDGCVTVQEGQICTYRENVLPLFINEWINVLNFVSNYNENAKKDYINASIKRNASIRHLASYRAQGWLNKYVLKRIKPYFTYLTYKNKLEIIFMAFLPRIFFIIPFKMYKKINNKGLS